MCFYCSLVYPFMKVAQGYPQKKPPRRDNQIGVRSKYLELLTRLFSWSCKCWRMPTSTNERQRGSLLTRMMRMRSKQDFEFMKNLTLPSPHVLWEGSSPHAHYNRKHPMLNGVFSIVSVLYVGDDLLSLIRSTIGAEKLNFRVRKENGCTLLAESPTYNTQTVNVLNTVTRCHSVNGMVGRERLRTPVFLKRFVSSPSGKCPNGVVTIVNETVS
jgi:hypothetical protein